MRESWGSLGYRGWEEATMELGNEQTRGRYLVHCNNCFRETKHLVIASKRQEYTEEDDDGNFIFGEKLNFGMLECCGCEGITFRRRCDASYEPHVVIDYFPPAVSRRKPEWLRGLTHVPIKLMFLMNEVYAALHSNSRSLAMMGARAMLDMAFVDTVEIRATSNRSWTLWSNKAL